MGLISRVSSRTYRSIKTTHQTMTQYLQSLKFQDIKAMLLLEKIEKFHSKRLWYQLTVELRKFVEIQEVQPILVEFYNKFISDIESRIDAFELVEIFIQVLRNVDNMETALEKLDNISEKVDKNAMAKQLIEITRAQIILDSCNDEINLRKVREIVKKLTPELEKEDGVSPVHSRFYRNTLRFLGCREDLDAEFDDSFEQIGFKLCLAALLADNVYNFGELLQHKILNSVKNGPNNWIVSLLQAFNSGDIDTIHQLRLKWESQADLLSHKSKLEEKWMLSALMEAVFSRSAIDRILSFQFISERTKIDLDKVEWLLMRVLSLNLVKGSIDQVEQTANLHWVQPRVLNKEQIFKMASKVESWVSHVDKQQNNIYERAKEIVQF